MASPPMTQKSVPTPAFSPELQTHTSVVEGRLGASLELTLQRVDAGSLVSRATV